MLKCEVYVCNHMGQCGVSPCPCPHRQETYKDEVTFPPKLLAIPPPRRGIIFLKDIQHLWKIAVDGSGIQSVFFPRCMAREELHTVCVMKMKPCGPEDQVVAQRTKHGTYLSMSTYSMCNVNETLWPRGPSCGPEDQAWYIFINEYIHYVCVFFPHMVLEMLFDFVYLMLPFCNYSTTACSKAY